MASETQYEARAIPTEGDVEGDMPRRLAAGPMHLIVYVREDVVAEIRTRLAACEGALRKIAETPGMDGVWCRMQARAALKEREAKQAKATASDVCSTTEKKRKGGMR